MKYRLYSEENHNIACEIENARLRKYYSNASVSVPDVSHEHMEAVHFLDHKYDDYHTVSKYALALCNLLVGEYVVSDEHTFDRYICTVTLRDAVGNDVKVYLLESNMENCVSLFEVFSGTLHDNIRIRNINDVVVSLIE